MVDVDPDAADVNGGDHGGSLCQAEAGDMGGEVVGYEDGFDAGENDAGDGGGGHGGRRGLEVVIRFGVGVWVT